MYNERNRSPMPSPRMPMQNGGAAGSTRAPMRDVPLEDLLDNARPRPDMTLPRRRCDGSLRDGAAREQMPDAVGGMFRAARNSEGQSCPSDCSRGACGGWGLEAHPLAMVYSPCQAWRDAYPPDVALSRGTLFSELDLPFEGGNCKWGCM